MAKSCFTPRTVFKLLVNLNCKPWILRHQYLIVQFQTNSESLSIYIPPSIVLPIDRVPKWA